MKRETDQPKFTWKRLLIPVISAMVTNILSVIRSCVTEQNHLHSLRDKTTIVQILQHETKQNAGKARKQLRLSTC